MIFDHISEILLWVAQIAIVAGVVAAFVYPAYRARQKRLPPGQWKATVNAAQRHRADYRGDNYGSNQPVRGEVAVRLTRPGGLLTIGTVKTDAADFEDRLTALVSDAEERANALNAAEEILR